MGLDVFPNQTKPKQILDPLPKNKILIKKVAVRTASPQYWLGTLEDNNSDLVTSNKCLFFLSETPFC